MSQPRHTSLGLEVLGGGLTVAALAATVARWLPLDFTYRPNALGIVSVTTTLRYPTHQETTLFLAFGAAGVGAMWLAAGWLGRRRFSAPARVAFELVALMALGASLMLARGPATLAVVAAAAVLVAIARRTELAPSGPPGATGPADATAAAPDGPRRASWTLGVAIVALAAVRAPRFVQGVHALGVSDSKLTRNDWVFLSEDGQHLAWADALANGGFHGSDIFCLYGPLFDWSVVWIWKLFGRSVSAWHLHVGLTEALAWLAFLPLAALFLRRRWLLLPLALFVPHLSLRIGLAFASLAFLLRHGRNGSTADAFAAGLLAGIALLYSQEFGAAVLVCGALLFTLRTTPKAIAAWAGAAALALVPLLLFYARAGALGAMLGDLVGYPSLLMAGFGNLPFPSLRATTPWPLWPEGPDARLMREFYAIPAVLVIALGACLPRRAPHPPSPLRWIARLRADLASHPHLLEPALLAIFGLAAFRTALGRSDQMHLYAVAAPSILLLAIGADRLLDRARQRPGGVAFQLALGGTLVALAGFATGTAAAGAFHLRSAWQTAAGLARGGGFYRGDGSVNRVVAWLGANTGPTDTFYALPNEAALYFLTGRPAPTRFVVSHQMVTDAHRAEALADLRAAPPRYVVWNDAALRLDGIGDEVVLGPALWDWIHAHYEPHERIGGMRIWEWSGDGEPAAMPRRSDPSSPR